MVSWNWIQRRFWEFRFGDSTYLRYLLSFIQFVIITYTLYVEEIAPLEMIFKSIYLFAIMFVAVYVPLGIIVGRVLHRKRQFRTEAILSTENNPLLVRSNRVLMEGIQQIFDALEIEPTKEWNELQEYWRKCEEKLKWKN